MTIEKEINEMTGTLSGENEEVVEEEIIKEPSVEDEEVEESDEDEGEEIIPEEAEPAPVEGSEKAETVTLLKSDLDEIKATLAELKGSKNPPPPAPEIADQDFGITEEDLEELNPSKFTAVLNKVYKKAMIDSKQILEEGILRSLPDTIRDQVNAFNSMQKVVDNFYSANKDLAKFKKVVGTVFKEVAAKSPNESFEKLLPMVSAIARKKLGLSVKADGTPPRPPVKKSSGVPRGRQPQKKSTLQDEIDSMSNVLGG